jgi:hypothetical protein
VLLSETTRALVGSSLPDGVAVFPLGERHLKGIDEPERVYELEIEGVEASAPAEPAPEPGERKPKAKKRDKDFERRFEDFGERLSASIQERVLRTLDRTLAKATPPPDPEEPADDEAVDEMATRAASLGDEIRARVEESLRRAGVPPDSPR